MPLLSIVRYPAAVEYYAEDFRYFRRDVKLTRLASVLDRLLELDILHAEITASQDEPVITRATLRSDLARHRTNP